MYARIHAAAAFRAIPSRILVDFKQIAGVEDQALRVFIGKLSDAHLIGPQDELSDRLDGLRPPGGDTDKWIAIFDACCRQENQRLPAGVIDAARVAVAVNFAPRFGAGEIGADIDRHRQDNDRSADCRGDCWSPGNRRSERAGRERRVHPPHGALVCDAGAVVRR